MYWELRTTPHADLVGESDDLEAMLELARECVNVGFPLDGLYICAEWDEGEAGDDADLPPVLAGAELAARIRPAGVGRRTASA